MKKPIVISEPNVSIELTAKQAIELGIIEPNYKGTLKTHGMWQIPVSFKALCVSKVFQKYPYTKTIETTLYGQRTLSNVRQGGYELEGYVSIKGKKYSAFTSSQSFTVDGKDIDVATIHARVK